MSWTKGPFKIAKAKNERQEVLGYTWGEALGIFKSSHFYTLTDLKSGRRLTTTTRLKEAKAIGEKLVELYDEQGRWHDIEAAKAKIVAVCSSWEKGVWAPDGDKPEPEELEQILKARKNCSRDEHISGAHRFVPVTPASPVTTKQFLYWLSWRYGAAVHSDPYRVDFRLGWIQYSLQIVTDPLAWPLWLEEVIPQLAQALGLDKDAVLNDIKTVASFA